MSLNFLCRIFGHEWRYKDTTKWIKLNGEGYAHTKTRRCIRCDVRHYLYDKWIRDELVPRNDKETIG
jgi:hypothetical protein